MLRKLSIVGVAGALVAVAAGGVTMALAAGDITQPETIVVVDTTVKDGFVDVGKEGFSLGDSFMFLDTLTEATTESEVGSARGQCTFNLRQWALCEAAFFIGERGEIFVAGAVRLTEEAASFDVPITGGTGEFENVRGAIHIEPVPGQEEEVSKITLNLIP